MSPRTYKNTSLLIRNYFALRCSSNGLEKGAGRSWEEEKDEDTLGYPIFHITVNTQECDNVMQRVLGEANGYES